MLGKIIVVIRDWYLVHVKWYRYSKYAGASSLIPDGYNGYIIDPEFDFSQDIQHTIDSLENRAKEFYSIFQKVLS